MSETIDRRVQPRETFRQFIERNPQYMPVPGEWLQDTYQKQIEGFSAYVDEQVAKKLQEIDAALKE